MLTAKTQCFWQIGDREKALTSATDFLRLSEKKKFGLVCIHIGSMMEIVLKVFFHWGTEELITRLLEAMEKWAASHPAVGSLRQEYLEKQRLRAATREVLQQQKQQEPAQGKEKEKEERDT